MVEPVRRCLVRYDDDRGNSGTVVLDGSKRHDERRLEHGEFVAEEVGVRDKGDV